MIFLTFGLEPCYHVVKSITKISLFVHKIINRKEQTFLWKRAIIDRQRVTIPFCKFNKYNYALGCRGFAAAGGVFDFNFKEELK